MFVLRTRYEYLNDTKLVLSMAWFTLVEAIVIGGTTLMARDLSVIGLGIALFAITAFGAVLLTKLTENILTITGTLVLLAFFLGLLSGIWAASFESEMMLAAILLTCVIMAMMSVLAMIASPLFRRHLSVPTVIIALSYILVVVFQQEILNWMQVDVDFFEGNKLYVYGIFLYAFSVTTRWRYVFVKKNRSLDTALACSGGLVIMLIDNLLWRWMKVNFRN